MKSSVALSATFAFLAWQCCQGVQMEEGSEEQFQVEMLSLTQCSSAVKKVQETGKYTEEAILPICSSVVRSSKCDFFSEALSLATSHTDFNGKVFCKNIAEAHFCSQTMDKLLTSPIMADLAFGACMRDKSSKGEQYCQRFSKMHAYAVQHDDLDTMRACYMIEAYDDSDRDSTKPQTVAPHEESNVKKAVSNSTKPQTKNQSVAPSTSKQHATVKEHQPKKANSTTASTQHAVSGKVVHAVAKNVSVKVDVAKNVSVKVNASFNKTTAVKVNASVNKTEGEAGKKVETSLVSSLFHTLSAVAHAVVKAVVPTHEVAAKSHNSTSASAVQTAKASIKKKPATDTPYASFAKAGASLAQARKKGVKQTASSSGKHAQVTHAVTPVSHSVGSKAKVSTHHGEVALAAKPSAPIKHGRKALVNPHDVAMMAKHSSSQKAQKKDEKKDQKKEDDKDKYGGFLSGFIP